MDLQLIGKEIRTFFNGLSKTISLVQGLPAEILEHPETHQPTIVTEDQTTQSRVSQSFDLIVLSVGLEPSDTLEKTAKILNLTPNSWGFFNTDTALVPQDVIIAGCAAGPKDILSSQQEGRIAAQKVLEELGMDTGAKSPVAVFGEGLEADRAAQALASKGYPAYLFGKGASLSESSPVTLLKGSRLISVNGAAGRFALRYESAGRTRQMECSAIVAAAQPMESPTAIKGPAHKVLSLGEFEQVLENTPDTCPENAAILLDYSGPEHKAPARLALTLALQARAAGRTISLIMNQMLVHGALGQRLYDEARRKGIDFFRYETRNDLQIEESGAGFRIKLKEATLPAILLDLSFNALVLPKSLAPAKEFADLAGLLRQPLDKEGFLQWANTRHRPTQSLRKNIFLPGLAMTTQTRMT
nr:hypothetical protein [Desulfobacula sp.]